MIVVSDRKFRESEFPAALGNVTDGASFVAYNFPPVPPRMHRTGFWLLRRIISQRKSHRDRQDLLVVVGLALYGLNCNFLFFFFLLFARQAVRGGRRAVVQIGCSFSLVQHLMPFVLVGAAKSMPRFMKISVVFAIPYQSCFVSSKRDAVILKIRPRNATLEPPYF